MPPARKIALVPQPASGVTRARLHASIREIGAAAWNACYPGELEDYAYLLAAEESGMPGFTYRYITIEENGTVLAAAPAFFTDYPLDATLGGTATRLLAAIRRRFPRFLVLKLACIGSPVTECARIGFLQGTEKAGLLHQLLATFEQDAASRGYRLLGAKDVPEEQKGLWDNIAHPLGFCAVASMATARLDIDFVTLDSYFARLSPATRKDMRRKLKVAADIRIEHRRNIDDMLPQVMALYRDTRERSDFAFEELTQAYFRGVLTSDHAFCTLYYKDNTLLAANLMLADKHRLLDKFFCMDGVKGRAHNLYYISWLTNIRYCLEHGIAQYQSGQAGYASKLRLRSRLTPNWLMFRHTQPLLGALLRLVAPMLAMDNAP